MLSQSQIQQIEPRIQVLRLLCLCLMVSAVVLAAVLYFVREEPKFTWELGMLQWIGIGFVVLEIGPACIVPAVMRSNASKQVGKSNERLNSEDYVSTGLVGAFVSSIIIQFAIFQGALFANLFFWLMEGSLYNLFAAGFCFLCMLFLFPGIDRSLSTIDSMLRDAKSSQR